jgi:hypothetical protein
MTWLCKRQKEKMQKDKHQEYGKRKKIRRRGWRINNPTSRSLRVINHTARPGCRGTRNPTWKGRGLNTIGCLSSLLYISANPPYALRYRYI